MLAANVVKEKMRSFKSAGRIAVVEALRRKRSLKAVKPQLRGE